MLLSVGHFQEAAIIGPKGSVHFETCCRVDIVHEM